MDTELQIACSIAEQAGKVILNYYQQGFKVKYKDAAKSDPVTEADTHANQIIVDTLREHFPDDGILSEELPAEDSRFSKQRIWCIDPIDGTRDFVEHSGDFVVMIGLAINGRAELGVVYQPTEDALFYGVVGQGAFVCRNQRPPEPLKTSTIHQASDTRLLLSRTHRSTAIERFADTLHIEKRLRIGSVGLKIAAICEDKADLYVSTSKQTHEWDCCAPEAILKAAGGEMTDICGRPIEYNKPITNTPFGILASNGALHSTCLKYLQPMAKELGWV